MCGRARCVLRREQLLQAVGLGYDTAFVHEDQCTVAQLKYSPVENMGPGRYAPVLLRHRSLDTKPNQKMEGPPLQLQAMKWGLIPSFTKPHVAPDHFLMFNARSENVLERPAFRRLVETKRCVVLCNGYYEWKQVSKNEKQPYYFSLANGRAMTMAGLYDQWTNDKGEVMHSFSILTTDIAPKLKWLHTRMPVILTPGGVSRWLSDAKFTQVRDLMVAYEGADLQWHPVDKKIGTTRYQGDDCAAEIKVSKNAGDIKAFFGAKPKPKEENTEPEPAIEKTEAPYYESKEQAIGQEESTSPSSALKTNESKPESPMKPGFVMASALDRKRFAASSPPAPESPQTPKKRKLPVKPAGRGQGTLDAFLRHK